MRNARSAKEVAAAFKVKALTRWLDKTIINPYAGVNRFIWHG